MIGWWGQEFGCCLYTEAREGYGDGDFFPGLGFWLHIVGFWSKMSTPRQDIS